MFLALNRSPSLQYQITKAVSLSGPLDLQEHIIYREDLKRTYIRDFGLQPQQNEKTWIAHRSPVANVSNLRKDLPILILQGTEDLRVSLNEGHHMTNVLERNGNLVIYLEIQDGNHCLANYPGRMNIITSWLEN